MLEKQQEDSLVARMKMFVHLRQDLERVCSISDWIWRGYIVISERLEIYHVVLERKCGVITDWGYIMDLERVYSVIKGIGDISCGCGERM